MLEVRWNINVRDPNYNLSYKSEIQFSDPSVLLYRGNGAYGSDGNILSISAYEWVVFLVSSAWVATRAERMRIKSNGYVGIGTANPAYELHVNGNVGANNVYAYNVFDPSDIRLKKDIVQLENALDSISNIRGVYFNYKDRPEKWLQVGVIAQEVETVLPEIVSEDADWYKSVDYSKLTPLLIEAVKELKAENAILKWAVCLDHPELSVCE